MALDDGLTDSERSEAAERWRSGAAARPAGPEMQNLKERLGRGRAPDFVPFLQSRLDEDEAFAASWRLGGAEYAGTGLPVDPARAMAEVQAKRAVLAAYMRELDEDQLEYRDSDTRYRDALAEACLAFAQSYADHPDFDPSWRVPPVTDRSRPV